MNACHACDARPPDGARFCPSCGAALAASAAPTTERKVVTTLFADLVGYTALGERHDPEDVDAALRAYFELTRSVIERLGGVVEKFIGDAVVGLFGVPLAREDDAERAILAALEIVARMGELPTVGGERLKVRAAVNTGLALVRLDTLAHSGEAVLVGDAVNTAARLLREAPEMVVVAGPLTHHLTLRTIAFEELPPIPAKDEAESVQRWIAKEPVGRRGIPAEGASEPDMIGREVELAVLSGLLDRAIASGRPQFALVHGEPGIGKSRLLREFFHAVDIRPGFLFTWRQGVCPPYGDGLAYWAVREIVTAHAGILPGDPADVAEQKLEAIVDDPDREWVLRRLRPLVGLSAEPGDREDSFAAWSRFLQGMGRDRPAVVVIEDLHWASEPTLAFLSHFVRHPSHAALLLVATSRPEFLVEHPELDEQAPGLVHVALKALDESESTRLAAELPGARDVPGLQTHVAGLCGGNPLFAEEFVRYLVERRTGAGDTERPHDDGPRGLPTSIQSLIAARLDALPPEHKSLMADASVVGPTFSPAVLHALQDDSSPLVEEALDYLELRELIRRAPDATPADTPTYTFWHALVQDVAYSTMPRTVRAVKHRLVAEWIVGLGGRPVTGELSEVVAQHYATAVKLADAGGAADLLAGLRMPARDALARAGGYAFALDVGAAEKHLSAALELCDEDEPEYAVLLSGHARCLAHLGRLTSAVQEWRDSVGRLMTTGRREKAVESMVQLARFLYILGDTSYAEVAARAVELAEQGPRGPEWLAAKAYWCFVAAASYEGRAAVSAADEALEAYKERGEQPPPILLGHRGMARCDLGDADGLDDLRNAIEETWRQSLPYDSAVLSYDYADAIHLWEGPLAALRVIHSAIDFCAPRGDKTRDAFLQADLLLFRAYAGQWDDVLSSADELIGELRRHGQAGDLVQVAVIAAYIRCLRQEPIDPADVRALCESTPPAGSDEWITYWSCLARVYGCAGDHDTALELLTRAADVRDGLHVPLQTGMTMSVALDACWAAGDLALAERFARGVPALRTIDSNIALTHSARSLEADGRLADAAAGHAVAAAAWHSFGTPFEEAQALVAQGRCLLGASRAGEADAPLRTAGRILGQLKARPLLVEARRLSEMAAGSPG